MEQQSASSPSPSTIEPCGLVGLTVAVRERRDGGLVIAGRAHTQDGGIFFERLRADPGSTGVSAE